jgi:hypothetical protein
MIPLLGGEGPKAGDKCYYCVSRKYHMVEAKCKGFGDMSLIDGWAVADGNCPD